MTELEGSESRDKPVNVPEALFKDVKYYVVGDIAKEVQNYSIFTKIIYCSTVMSDEFLLLLSHHLPPPIRLKIYVCLQ